MVTGKGEDRLNEKSVKLEGRFYDMPAFFD